MLDLPWCRAQFPALARTLNGRPAVYFDGPAGSQTPQRVVDAISRYLLQSNANHGGVFTTARESDTLLAEAHRAAADLVGTADADCIAFGPNMTTLTFALSRALARTWKAGDEVIVTRLDHDANVSPWVLAARDAGAIVRKVGIRPDCTLDLDDLHSKLSARTKLVAVGCASNAVGSINPVKQIAEWCHAAGSLVFLDAVHHAPHLPMDVTAWDCDFLACSAYKVCGPHIGMLYGKRQHLETLPAYKLRPASDEIPGKWMTGTQSHEGIAGTLAAIDYLADLGRRTQSADLPRRAALLAAYDAIGQHERELARLLLSGLAELKDVRIWGITDLTRLHERVATFSLTHARRSPQQLAEHLDRHGIFTWHGNFYAQELTETLGVEPAGMLRIGLLHYNTKEEVARLLQALAAID